MHREGTRSSRMLKKSLFSPALPRRAETRLFPYGVLASLRGSTYRSVRLAASLAAALPAERRVLARRGGRVRSLAFLSILRAVLLLFQAYSPMKFRHAHRVFPQPAR